MKLKKIIVIMKKLLILDTIFCRKSLSNDFREGEGGLKFVEKLYHNLAPTIIN